MDFLGVSTPWHLACGHRAVLESMRCLVSGRILKVAPPSLNPASKGPAYPYVWYLAVFYRTRNYVFLGRYLDLLLFNLPNMSLPKGA